MNTVDANSLTLTIKHRKGRVMVHEGIVAHRKPQRRVTKCITMDNLYVIQLIISSIFN